MNGRPRCRRQPPTSKPSIPSNGVRSSTALRVDWRNAAWPRLSADRKKLNPTFLAIVKAGFKAERIDDDDDVSVARDNQILTDEEVGAILQAACEVDQEQGFDGDLYRIVVCLAATGARYAQVRRMRVGDVHPHGTRLHLCLPLERERSESRNALTQGGSGEFDSAAGPA